MLGDYTKDGLLEEQTFIKPVLWAKYFAHINLAELHPLIFMDGGLRSRSFSSTKTKVTQLIRGIGRI